MATVGTSQPDEALRLAYEIHPQLIIMDVMLSGASGIEVAVKLRDGAFGTTPIIAISASALMLDFARQMGAFDAYLTKPFAFFGHSMGGLISFELARQGQHQHAPIAIQNFKNGPATLFVEQESSPKECFYYTVPATFFLYRLLSIVQFRMVGRTASPERRSGL